MPNPYRVLGVSEYASFDEIKKAYRTLSRKYHPDSNPNDPDPESTKNNFRRIQEAYEAIEKERNSPDYKEHRTHNSHSGSNTYDDDNLRYPGYDYGKGEEMNDTPEYKSAVSFISSGQFDEAIAVLESIPFFNRNARWYYLHACINLGLQNTTQARIDIETASSLDPSNEKYHELYETLSKRTGWHSEKKHRFAMKMATSWSKPVLIIIALIIILIFVFKLIPYVNPSLFE